MECLVLLCHVGEGPVPMALVKHVMMKPPFKASDGVINGIHAPWCTVCFIKLYKHDFEVMKYNSYVMCNIRFIITSPSGLVIINLI